MKQRVFLLSVTTTIVCAVALSTALLTNSLGHSHAIVRTVTAQAATSPRSYGVVVGSTYYGSTNQDVYALNAQTGALLWKHPTSTLAFLLTVALGNVYFVAGDAYALNATTGAVVWKSQATINSVPVALFVNNGVLYVEAQAEASFFSALNASNGKLLWAYVIGSYSSSFALVQGVLYIATYPFPALCAVQVSNGSQIWCHDYFGYGGVSTPIVTGSIVTVGYYSDDGSGNYSYEIDAFNSSNGSLVWQSQNVYQLGASQGMIYAAVAGSNVVEALNALNGALIWKNSIGTGNVTQTGDIVRNGVLYTSNSNNEVDAISTANGALLWHYNVGAQRLIIANGVVYANIGSALYALHASNGSLIWKSSTSGILCAVSVKLGMVYLVASVTNNPVVYALSIQTGHLLWTY